MMKREANGESVMGRGERYRQEKLYCKDLYKSGWKKRWAALFSYNFSSEVPCDIQITLFFEFLKWSILLLFILFIPGGVYNLKTNSDGNYCQNKKDCSNLAELSLHNKENDPEALETSMKLILTSIVLWLVGYLWYLKSHIQFLA